MITKNQAALLWANNYRLVAYDGKKFEITELHKDGMWTKSESNHYLFLKYIRIGIDYFILARPLSDLTKEITHEGEKFVPINRINEINGSFAEYSHTYPIESMPYRLVDKLKEWHFNISFPEGSVKTIKDER